MDDAGEIRPKDAGEELLERYPSSLNDAGEFEALLAGFATVAFFNDCDVGDFLNFPAPFFFQSFSSFFQIFKF